MRSAVIKTALICGLAQLAAGPATAAEPVIVDLGESDVSIDLRFNGTDLLIFGVIQKGEDVVIVVRGPKRGETVHRKEQIGGIWANGESWRFENVPSFYALASSRPLDEVITDKKLLLENEIGIRNVLFDSVSRPNARRTETEFRNALLTTKIKQGLFTAGAQPIRLNAGRLFRTTIYLPSTVTTGVYDVRVFGVRNGHIVTARASALTVKKVGMEARVSEYSREHATLYGVVAVLIALFAGWFVAFIFRRV